MDTGATILGVCILVSGLGATALLVSPPPREDLRSAPVRFMVPEPGAKIILARKLTLEPLMLALPECTSCADNAIGISLKTLTGKEPLTIIYPSKGSKAEWSKLYPKVG